MMKYLFLLFFFLTYSLLPAQNEANREGAVSEAEANVEIAINAYNSGDLKKGIDHMRLAIIQDPDNAEYHSLLGAMFLNVDEDALAYRHMSEAIRLEPENPVYYNIRGVYSKVRGLFNQADVDFGLGMKFAKNDTILNLIRLNRASVKEYLGEDDLAEKYYLECYHYDSTSSDMLNNFALFCSHREELEKAVELMKKAIYYEPKSTEFLGNLGFLYQRMEMHDKALPILDEVLELKPDFAFGYSNRSYSKMKTGDLKGAMKDIEYSIKLNPENPWAYRNRGLIYNEMGKGKKACEDFYLAEEKGFSTFYGNEVKELIKKNCGE